MSRYVKKRLFFVFSKKNKFQKKWTEKMLPDEQQPPAKRGKDSKDTHMSALENMSTNPNYRKK